MRSVKNFNLFLFACISLMLLYSCGAKQEDNSTISDPFIRDIIGKMSLEDKVGEMTQLTLDMLCVGAPYALEEPHRLDSAKLKNVLVDLKVGSILNCGGHEYSREQWHEFINTIQHYATNKKESGIPVLYGIDAIHGTNYTEGATLFPQQLGLAATWDPQIAKRMGEIVAYETRASGIPWNFSPVLDVGRDVRWPRLWESFGEDVLLCTEMGDAMVSGYQGTDISADTSVAACLKHFLGYSQVLSGKDRTQAWIPERQLREYFLPPFESAIDKGAKTIMVNSGEINGIPVHINKWILTDLLRDELGFEGLVVTDWEDIKYLFSRHHAAEDYKSAIKMAIDAGIDMSMVPVDLEFPVLLKELVEEGEITESRIDMSVARILKVKKELGLFERPTMDISKYPRFGGKEHELASLNAAEESITLLKNDNEALPLNKNASILLSGPTANSLNYINGGWTHTWQGDDPKFNTKGKKNIKEALQDEFDNVSFIEGCSYDEDVNTSQFAAKVQNNDAVVICIGEKTYTETPGDIEDMDLPQVQYDLVKEAVQKGKPVILVYVGGRPRVINQIADKVDAIVYAYLPGDMGGVALANILSGDVNPSGKLPFTYSREGSAHTTYDHKYTDQIDVNFALTAFDPLFEFGHGLSYTTFEYSDLSIDKTSYSENDEIKMSVTVSNTGDLEGKEVVQVYVSDLFATITPSVKRLRAFEKVELGSGESRTVDLSIPISELAYVAEDLEWHVGKGDFILKVGGLEETFEVK
ncbi:MAG: beta-glucosidase [Flavobacteriales bacterium]|nr:beta-glucosidase [Flavobacteriales bacterium]